jgi:hypothetical protein
VQVREVIRARTAIAAIIVGVFSLTPEAWSQEGAETQADNRIINLVPSVKGANLFPLKNPGVVTLGTLSIQNRIDFAISAYTTLSTNGNAAGGALTHAWDWGDGTPPGSGPFPNHTYVVAGTYTITVTTAEAGNPKPRVDTISVAVTDSVKSNKLQTNENWKGANGDSLSLKGIVHVPTNVSLAGQTALFDIGGIQLAFTLNASGSATLTSNANLIVDPLLGTSSTTVTSSKASFKLVVHKRAPGVAFVDAPFTLTVKDAAFSPALADETITNRTANRDNVRITVRLTAFGILYQTGINQLYTSTMGGKGKTR